MKKFTVPGRKCVCGCKKVFPVTREDRVYFNNQHASHHWREIEKAKLPPELRNRQRGRPRKP